MCLDKDINLDNEEFCLWIIEKAKSTDPMEMLEDKYFVSRLLNSIALGRSTKFNQQQSEGGRNSAMTLLVEEYKNTKRR